MGKPTGLLKVIRILCVNGNSKNSSQSRGLLQFVDEKSRDLTGRRSTDRLIFTPSPDSSDTLKGPGRLSCCLTRHQQTQDWFLSSAER